MNKNVKSALHSRFTEDDLKIINEIVITLALVFQNIIKNLNSEKILKESSKMTSSLQYSTSIVYAIMLTSLYQEQGRFPNEIKNEIIKVLTGGHQQTLLHNQTVISKVLKGFKNKGVIWSIVGKKDIKVESPKSIPRKPKVGRSRRVGPYIISKLTTSAADYERVLSNPQAIELINNTLLEYGILRKMYDVMLREAFQAFRKGDKDFYDNLMMIQAAVPNMKGFSLPDPKLIQEQIKLLSEVELKDLQKKTADHFVNNPSFSVYFIFSLQKLLNSENEY